MIRYRKKKSNKPFLLTVILLLLLIFFSHRNPETARMSSSLLNRVISPINQVFYTISVSLQDTYDSMFGSKATQAKVDQLTTENEVLMEKNRQLEAVVNEQTFLQDEYELLSGEGKDAVQATVTAMDPSNTFVQFTIDKGSKDGVETGDIVVQGVQDQKKNVVKGLVGRVTEVGPNYAKVSSILDQANNVSIVFQSTGAYGVINSRDQEAFFGYSLDTSTNVRMGEEVFTSGIGGIYPRGYYVGRVSNVQLSDDELSKNITVESHVDFSRLYRVLVFSNTLVEEDANE